MKSLSCFILGIICAASIAAKSGRAPTYDRGANDAFDTILWVGGEWRAQHKAFKWGELELECAKRMNVKRKEPWSK